MDRMVVRTGRGRAGIGCLTSRWLRRLVASTALAAGTLIDVAPARAACDAPHVLYEFSSPRRSRLLTNLRGDWAEAGFTATYSKTTTATATASVTATVGAEAGVVFAKASTSIGVTVGGSWSVAGSWSYSKQVPAGKEGRIVMYRESRTFTVTKKRFKPPCGYTTVYRGAPVNAPVARGENVWRMQLRPLSQGVRGAAAAADDQAYEEIDVAIEQDK